ncbi:hypothetical protein CL647_01345 [bacterium]|nr:hypothetical protein [Actinomycetota bacterium]MBE32765.1 hypothetical protein [bacterium]|tara:strand:+ start:3243 stop:3758 length:516 start_codon:yes stop_codon:yes gene_type:complete
MNQNEKKYTVYEIEKLSKGKLTKYKLTKAILAGELQAEEVKEKKRGRGLPNYFIFENNLNKYLEKMEKNKKHHINIPQDTVQSKYNVNQENTKELQELLKQNIDNFNKLESRLTKIQNDYDLIIPMLEKQNINPTQNIVQQRKQIIEELANTPAFQMERREELIKKLDNIG